MRNIVKVWRREGEDFEKLMMRFKRKCSNENVLQEYEKKEHYQSKTEIRKQKEFTNKKRGRK